MGELHLTGDEFLVSAIRAAPIGDWDAIQDIAVELVAANPHTFHEANNLAYRIAARLRKRRQRRATRFDASPHTETECGDVPSTDRVVEMRAVLRDATDWAVRHGRVPSRTTLWRLKQKRG